MSTSHNSSLKNKAPRVLANTVKKPDKSLNSSSNRSFHKSFNKSFHKKSSNFYIQDLRKNNAKLASALSLEKLKSAGMYRRIIENQKLLLHKEAEFRGVARNIKTGVKCLNDSVELMCQGISILSDLNEQLNTLYPEPKESSLPPVSVGVVNPPSTSTAVSQASVGTLNSPSPSTTLSPASFGVPNASSSATSAVGNSLPVVPQTLVSRTDVPVQRQCGVMPMVKGQIISKPIISLQRVKVPVGFRKTCGAPLQPVKGAFIKHNGPSRLSDVTEEAESSNEDSPNASRLSSSPNRRSILNSELNSTNTLPASRVVLERIESDFMLPSNEVPVNEDQDQLTIVNFGSFSFGDITKTLSSKPSSPSNTKEEQNHLDRSKNTSNSSDSDEYETESDDEELALQIVESKKSFTERKRQLDSKEGTSWNYDDAGRYHGRPPKRKATTGSKSSNILASPSKPNHKQQKAANVSSPKGLRSTRSSEKVTSPKFSTKYDAFSKTSLSDVLQSPEEDGTNQLDTTCLDEMSMSFTCVTAERLPVVLAEVSAQRAQASSEIFNQHQNSEREMFVTQRPRGKKHLPESSKLPDLSQSNLSPPSPIKVQSDIENNENSPPSLIKALKNEWISESYVPGSLPQANVVLERLPSNVISGNRYLPDCSDSSIPSSAKSPGSTQSKKRFKCLITNSATSSGESKNEKPRQESENMEDQAQSISKSKSKERRKIVESPVGPKVPRMESHSSSNNSGESRSSESKKSQSPEEESGVSLDKKKQQGIEEHEPSAPKARKRNTKSQRSFEGTVSRASSSSSTADEVGLEHVSADRPRRHAAPINLKEPKCNVKMRRT